MARKFADTGAFAMLDEAAGAAKAGVDAEKLEEMDVAGVKFGEMEVAAVEGGKTGVVEAEKFGDG